MCEPKKTQWDELVESINVIRIHGHPYSQSELCVCCGQDAGESHKPNCAWWLAASKIDQIVTENATKPWMVYE